MTCRPGPADVADLRVKSTALLSTSNESGTAKRTGFDHMVRHPQTAPGVMGGHGGPKIERCPWRPARISKPMSTSAWTIIIVLTTAAIVPEPPVAAFVPLTTL